MNFSALSHKFPCGDVLLLLRVWSFDFYMLQDNDLHLKSVTEGEGELKNPKFSNTYFRNGSYSQNWHNESSIFKTHHAQKIEKGHHIDNIKI